MSTGVICRRVALSSSLGVALAAFAASAQEIPLPRDAQLDGVHEDRVVFGQSAALTGPVGSLGTNMRLGIRAAFEVANRQGGVHGRRLELRSLDDLYEPEQAIRNTRHLIEDPEEPVFALIGAVGTPSSRSSAPIASNAGVPYIAPLTGAGLLRDPKLASVVNIRASYEQETEEIVARLVRDLEIFNIAVLYQDDSYGRAGYRGVVQALGRRRLSLVGEATYVRNTSAVKIAVLDLRQAAPQAVVIIGAPEPVATAISWSRHIGFTPVFVTISSSGGNELVDRLGRFARNVYVTQVVPFPESDEPAARSYRRALRALDRSAVPGFVSFEGYLGGRLVIKGLERAGAELTRRRFLDALLQGDPFSIDGFRVAFGERDNQGSDSVFLTLIQQGGVYVPISRFALVGTP